MIEGVSLSAILQGIRTEASGGWRITFDVPNSESDAILELSKLRDIVLQLGIVINANSDA